MTTYASDRTYKNLKLLISNNRYEYEDMMNKLDLFLMMDRITEEQYLELVGMMVKPEEPAEDITEKES